ncbi:hypothetical protein SAMN05660337_2852 [Maridesulfovibrio ferrireducens]|uniref:Uncharacterized protein n=1 Tax=Maridesulfovibrio ferrireducens TaxID=246191 RepID=A0A1G9JM02_9BACT|nr:hypothetical protein [Maridesulfovibrio ferrireducens]SDL38336.1 hypothetical protein SAMN05660337_2852 [Maridesulfovibrio ferrireducens]
MITDTATIILFAIQATVKIGEAGYKNYIDATRNRDLILPLPEHYNKILPTQAWNFFFGSDAEGKRFASGDSVWPELIIFENRLFDTYTDEDKELLCKLAEQAYNILELERFPDAKPNSTINLINFHVISAWEEGYSTTTAVQRVAGAIIEIGIDYAKLNPGLFDTKTSNGKLLYSLINELDKIKFSDSPIDELPALLFVATLETLTTNTKAISSDPNIRVLISNSAKKVASLVGTRNTAINALDIKESEKRDKRKNMEDWGELIFRGVLDSVGHTMLASPGQFLGVQGEASQTLVTQVGNDVLDLMIGDDSINLDPIFCKSGAERLMRTALDVVSKHPKLITNSDNSGINAILSAVTKELRNPDQPLLEDYMIPEIGRIILEKTGENLTLLWPSAPNTPESNLLLIASKATLKALSASTTGEYWTPDFTHKNMLFVVETVCNEIKCNPGWITGDDKYLNNALILVLENTVLCLEKKEITISGDTAASILTEVVKSISLRKELFDQITYKTETLTVAAAAIDAIVYTIFSSQEASVKWILCRDETLTTIVNVLMTELAKSSADVAAVTQIQQIVDGLINDLKNGKKFDLEKFAEHAALQL